MAASLKSAVRRSWVVRRLKKVVWDFHRHRRGWVVAKLDGGACLRLPCGDRLGELIYFWDFERKERDFVRAVLRPGDVFVDVGANLGLFAVIAGRCVGAQGRVFAFEPAHASYQRLQDNVTLNRLANATCSPLALSDVTGEIQLHESRDGFDAWNSAGAPTRGSDYASSTVSCVRWDEFAEAEGLVDRVAMMKVDVEGWESRVLLGGRDFFTRDKAPILQVEFCDSTAVSAGSSCAELYGTLRNFGYVITRFDPTSGLEPEELRSEYPYENLYAVKDLKGTNARLGKAME